MSEHKEAAVGMFLAGRSIGDVAAFYGVNKLTVEHVVRQALRQFLLASVPEQKPAEEAVRV